MVNIANQSAENIINVETQKIFYVWKENPFEGIIACLFPFLGSIAFILINTFLLDDPFSYLSLGGMIIAYFAILFFFFRFFKTYDTQSLLFISLFLMVFLGNSTYQNYFQASLISQYQEDNINFAFLKMIYEDDLEIQKEASMQWKSVIQFFEDQFLTLRLSKNPNIDPLNIITDFTTTQTEYIESEIEKDYLASYLENEDISIDAVFFGSAHPDTLTPSDISFLLQFLLPSSQTMEMEIAEGLSMDIVIGNIFAKATLDDKKHISLLFSALAFFVEEDYAHAEELFLELLEDKEKFEDSTYTDLSLYLASAQVMQQKFSAAEETLAKAELSAYLSRSSLIAGKYFHLPLLEKKHDRERAHAYNLLGVIEMGLGNYESAEQYFEEIEELDHAPELAFEKNNKAVSYVARGLKEATTNPQKAKEKIEYAYQMITASREQLVEKTKNKVRNNIKTLESELSQAQEGMTASTQEVTDQIERKQISKTIKNTFIKKREKVLEKVEENEDKILKMLGTEEEKSNTAENEEGNKMIEKYRKMILQVPSVPSISPIPSPSITLKAHPTQQVIIENKTTEEKSSIPTSSTNPIITPIQIPTITKNVELQEVTIEEIADITIDKHILTPEESEASPPSLSLPPSSESVRILSPSSIEVQKM